MHKKKIGNLEPTIIRLGPNETGIHLAENLYRPSEKQRISDQARVDHWLELAQEMLDSDDPNDKAA